MLRRLCLMLAALLVLGPGLSHADTDLAANAALTYWQAFATLPKLSDDDQKAVMSQSTTMPLDAHVEAMVKSADYSLQMLHLGAAVRPCDWGIDWKAAGSETQLPQMSAARELAGLARLRARLAFQDGRAPSAVDDLLAALALGRQVSLDGSLIGVLTGYAIEAHVNETLASGLPQLDAKALEDLKSRLAALPPGGRPAQAMTKAEASYVDWIAGKAKKISTAEELQKLMIDQGLVSGTTEKRAAKARALVEACGGTPDGFVRRLEEMHGAFGEVAKLLDLPLGNSEREIDLATKSLQANPVFEFTFPSALACRQAQARTDVRRALLVAAVDIQLRGRDALKEHLDPVTGGPFEMTPFDGGFELRSTWAQKAGPISLAVGRRAK